MVEQQLVLYVNKFYESATDYDPGSSECLKIVQGQSDCLVQDVDHILSQGVQLPAWLDGTPLVVDTKSSTAVKGSSAIAFLRQHYEKKDREKTPVVEEIDDGDPFKQDPSSVSSEIMDRVEGKVTEEKLAQFIMSREKLETAQPRPPANALPDPLPANS